MPLPEIPVALVILPMLALFLLRLRRYYLRDPDRRVSDPDFLVSSGAVVIAIGTAIAHAMRPEPVVVQAGFVAGLALCAVAVSTHWIAAKDPA